MNTHVYSKPACRFREQYLFVTYAPKSADIGVTKRSRRIFAGAKFLLKTRR